MTTITVSEIVDRPPPVVFDFCVVHHLQNHPRWDPAMQLSQLTDGPVGVGTRFSRRHVRGGTAIRGTMEVVEFDADRSFGAVIHDETPSGPLHIRSRMTLEPLGPGRTALTVEVELPEATAPIDPTMIQASLRTIKELIEAER